jgi:hypothetical protein
MKKATSIAMYVIAPIMFIVLAITAFFPQEATAQLPAGNWTEASHPGWIEGAQVNVGAVVTQANQGLTITSTRVKNHTNKTVTAVKLAWYILSEQTGKTALQSDSTPLISVSGGIPPHGLGTVDYAVVSFANEAASLSSSGSLTGNYHVFVFVDEAHFSDGTIFDPDVDTLFASPIWIPPWLFGDCASCQNQNCKWSNSNNCYQCGASSCEMCSVSSCNSCTNSRCEIQPAPQP